MANMRMLIRIVFVIFIANVIDCLGSVCDNCCDCFKEEIKENEEIEKDKNNPAKNLVNYDWYNAKKNKPVLKIFEKEENGNVFISTGIGDKISFKLDKDNNSKIAYQNETENEPKLKDPLNVGGKKYALFEIKEGVENIVYLYCSDVESIGNDIGIFKYMYHISISVIACDTENVMNMNSMFYYCYTLEKLDLQNFNTTNVTNMRNIFHLCRNLTELNIQSFNTINVTDMRYMFAECSSLTKLNIQSFNTSNVTNMDGMFSRCSGLENLNLNNFNTEKVTNMRCMFLMCISLGKLEFGKNFNTTKVTDVEFMFKGCKSFPENIRSNLNDVEGIINFFKEKNQ